MSTMTLESTAQMDILPPETIITLTHEGMGAEQWKKTSDNLWENITRTGARPLDAQKFRGAVKAGRVRRSAPGETAEEMDPMLWRVGDWWVHDSYTDRAWLVTNENQTGSVHNALVVHGYRCERAVITNNDMNSGSYHRQMDSEMLPDSVRWFLAEPYEAIRKGVKVEVPDGVIEAVKAYAAEEGDDDLFEVLQKNGVDTAVMTTCDLSGTVTIPKTNLAALLGTGVNVQDSDLDVEWDHSFQIKVKRGCICDDDWQDAVVNTSDLLAVLPLNAGDDYEVSLNCPLHDV